MDATARAQRARPKRVGQHANVGGCMRRIRIMMRSSPERSTFFNSLLVACNRQSGSDPMPRIGVFPLHGFRGRIVLPDIAHDFPFQIMPGCEDAAGDDIALDLGKPQFDLVQPR